MTGPCYSTSYQPVARFSCWALGNLEQGTAKEAKTIASIKKLDNGFYRARVYVGRDDMGKQVIRSVTRRSLKEVKKAAREMEREIEEGELMNVASIRFVAAAEHFLNLYKHEYAPGTISLYRSYLKNHYKPFFGKLKLEQIDEMHIKKFKAGLLEQGLEASSVRRIMGALKRILREFLKDAAPTKDVPLPKANKPKSKAPSREEFQEIWDASKGTEMEIKILLAGWCGLRRGEVLALKPDDFDFEAGTIRVDEAVSMDGKEVRLKTPKSDNGYRVEIIPRYLLQLIQNLIKKRSAGKVVDIKSPEKDRRLFEGRPDSLTTNYTRFVERHQLPKYTFHDLRHYHATWLYDNEVPDLYAAKRLGHSVDTLKSVYQHLGLERQREIEKKILAIDPETPPM